MYKQHTDTLPTFRQVRTYVSTHGGGGGTADTLHPYYESSYHAKTTYTPLVRIIGNGYGILGGGNLTTDRTIYVDTTNISTLWKCNTKVKYSDTLASGPIATKNYITSHMIGGSSKMKFGFSAGQAELVGASSEPLLIGGSGGYVNWAELDYDDSNNEASYFTVRPEQTSSYGGGTITVNIVWEAVAVTGAVKWSVSLSSVVPGTAFDGHYSISTHTSNTTVAGTTMVTNSTTFTFTPDANEITAGQMGTFILSRVATDSGDTMIGVAKVLSVSVNEN